MSKVEKLEETFTKIPLKPFYDYEDVKKYLEYNGFKNIRTKGSHNMFVATAYNGEKVSLLISTVNGRKVKAYLIKLIMKTIKEMR